MIKLIKNILKKLWLYSDIIAWLLAIIFFCIAFFTINKTFGLFSIGISLVVLGYVFEFIGRNKGNSSKGGE